MARPFCFYGIPIGRTCAGEALFCARPSQVCSGARDFNSSAGAFNLTFGETYLCTQPSQVCSGVRDFKSSAGAFNLTFGETVAHPIRSDAYEPGLAGKTTVLLPLINTR